MHCVALVPQLVFPARYQAAGSVFFVYVYSQPFKPYWFKFSHRSVLLHCDVFGEVAGLVCVAAAADVLHTPHLSDDEAVAKMGHPLLMGHPVQDGIGLAGGGGVWLTVAGDAGWIEAGGSSGVPCGSGGDEDVVGGASGGFAGAQLDAVGGIGREHV